MKETEEQPDEGIHRGRPGSVRRLGNPVPVEVSEAHHPPGEPVFTQPHILGILWRLPYVSTANHSLHYQLLSPLCRMGAGTKNSKRLIMGWSFWWLVPIREPTRSCSRTGDAPVLLSLWKLQGFQGLCARNWGQRAIYIFSTISHFSKQY